MKTIKTIVRFLKFLWVAVTIIVLVSTILKYQQHPENEVIMLGDMLMNVLCLPISIVTSILIMTCNYIYYWRPASGTGQIMLTWSVHFIAGYLQWFVFLPFLLRKIDKNKNTTER